MRCFAGLIFFCSVTDVSKIIFLPNFGSLVVDQVLYHIKALLDRLVASVCLLQGTVAQ